MYSPTFKLSVRLPVVIMALSLTSCISFHADSSANQVSATRRPILLVTDTPLTGTTVMPVTPVNPVDVDDQADDQLITVDFADVIGTGPQFYGVEYSWIDQDPDLYLDRYRRLHGNVVRAEISQDLFEPVNDNDDPDYSEIDFSLTIPLDSEQGTTMTYNSMFKSLAAEFPDMHFQINVWLAARWNATDPDGYLGIGGAFPPIDYAEHREFIRALAHWLIDDCGVSPEHLSFAFVNEPNLRGFFVGTQADLVRMAEETRTALDQVSPLIQMGGLDEVHGTSWTDGFYRQRPAGCCDMWTFHAYERGLPAMWSALQERTERLSRYGPVWVIGFADTTNGSPDGKMDFSTREAALGFAELLGRLWPTEIDGIVHFRLSDTYTDLFDFGGWVGHGLFADARGTHSDGQAYELFAVYWVFANMYRELGGGQIVSTTAPSGLTVVSARKDSETEARLAVWVTNSTTENYTTAFRVSNFPTRTARVQVFDNLAGDTPVETQVVNGEELTFGVNIPPQSSYLFVVSTSVLFGDFDGDGDVDVDDIMQVASRWCTSCDDPDPDNDPDTPSYDPLYDVDDDCDIDIVDIMLVAAHWGETCPTPTPTATPAFGDGLITDIVVSNGKTYEKDTLSRGKLVYTDRNYTFTSVPARYEGQEFIHTANNDKHATNTDFQTFTLAADATDYVAYDDRATSLPAWLDESWTLTGDIISTSDAARVQVGLPGGPRDLGRQRHAPHGRCPKQLQCHRHRRREPTAVNQASVVDAGLEQTITLSTLANLDGTVTDDGYLVNDWADVDLDRRAGKRNVFSGMGRGKAALVVMAVLVLVVALGMPFVRRPGFLPLWVAWGLAATFYSLPPVRLKERGALGLTATIIAQQPIPAAMAFAALGYLHTWGALAFIAYITLRGISSDVGHQMRDWSHDASTDTGTFAVRHGYGIVQTVYALSLEAERLALGGVMALLLLALPPVTLPLVGWRVALAWPLALLYAPLCVLTAGRSWRALRQGRLASEDPYDEARQARVRDALHVIHHPLPSVLTPLYLAGWLTLFYWPNAVFVLTLGLLYGLYSPQRWAATWPLSDDSLSVASH